MPGRLPPDDASRTSWLSPDTARLVAIIIALAALTLGVVLVIEGAGSRGPSGPDRLPASPAGASDPPATAPVVSAAQLAALPEVSTLAVLGSAPPDNDPDSDTAGSIVHNRQSVAVFTRPGGTPFVRLAATQAASATWLPVIDATPGWVRVLLPSRPNGSTGWLQDSDLVHSHTPYRLRVHLVAAIMQLLHDGHPSMTWRVGVGAPTTPTPTGRTFLSAAGSDPGRQPPQTLTLGVHGGASPGDAGGLAAVVIQPWPATSAFGLPVCHGCLRVPSTAMPILLAAPLGTLVLITTR
jgi:hypothetical protein